MKRIITVITAIAMIASAMSFCAVGVVAAGDFSYSIADGEVTITKYNGTAVAVEVPSVVEGLPVTIIGDGAFRFNSTVKSVVIPEGVRTVMTRAFDYCTGLENVVLPQKPFPVHNHYARY